MITYSAAISACEKGKQPDKALELLEDMQQKGLRHDTIGYSAAISTYEKGKQPDKALGSLEHATARPETRGHSSATASA